MKHCVSAALTLVSCGLTMTVAACGGSAGGSAAGHTVGAASAGASSGTSASGTSASGTSASAGASAGTSAGTSGDTALGANLCALLKWSDLGYPGIGKDALSPTQSGKLKAWDQSCFWASQQFDAGYTPPHDASCDKTSGNAGQALRCVGVEAETYASIISNSKWVKLTVAWRGRLSTVSPVSYVQNGNPVYLSDDPADSSCTGGLNWASGTLVVLNQDPTKAFGPVCGEVKKVIALLIKRQPR